MKKVANPIPLRAAVATALCLSFLIPPSSWVSSAAATTVRAAADLKNESQYKSEASRYDSAIRAIAGIATMKLDTGEDLKKAIAILDRERQNLKFHRSKLIVLALGDSAFTSAVKKKVSDKPAAEAFASELTADRKAVLKLEGAESLKTRLQRSAESDAATLRRVAERLREAAERIKKAGQKSAAPGLGVAGEFRVVRAGFSEATEPVDAHHALAMTPQRRGNINPFARVLLDVVLITSRTVQQAIADLFRPFEEEDLDQVAACQTEADAGLSTCLSEANRLPSGPLFFQREVQTAFCYERWALEWAACLALSVL
jgi:hypothetical protein